jgi:hypothetical protein
VIHNAIVQSERDWNEDEQSARHFRNCLGVRARNGTPVCGWREVLREVADKFAWSEEQIVRLARLKLGSLHSHEEKRHLTNYFTYCPRDSNSRAKSSFPCLGRNLAARWRSFGSFGNRSREYRRKKSATIAAKNGATSVPFRRYSESVYAGEERKASQHLFALLLS